MSYGLLIIYEKMLNLIVFIENYYFKWKFYSNLFDCQLSSRIRKPIRSVFIEQMSVTNFITTKLSNKKINF